MLFDRESATARRDDIAVLVPARTSLPFLEDALENAAIPYRAEASSLVGPKDKWPRIAMALGRSRPRRFRPAIRYGSNHRCRRCRLVVFSFGFGWRIRSWCWSYCARPRFQVWGRCLGWWRLRLRAGQRSGNDEQSCEGNSFHRQFQADFQLVSWETSVA